MIALKSSDATLWMKIAGWTFTASVFFSCDRMLSLFYQRTTYSLWWNRLIWNKRVENEMKRWKTEQPETESSSGLERSR